MTESTDWMSALAILASGLILGTLFIFMLRRKKGSATASNGRLELEARRDLLIEQLRDDEVAADDRMRLERETAEVLRELDHLGGEPAPVVVQRANPAVKGFLWGVACTLALAGLGLYVYASAEKKAEPSQAMPVQQAAAAAPAAENGLAQLQAAVEADPDNVNHRIALAKIYFDNDNLMGTFEQTKAALAKDPNEPRALTYNAIVRMAMGQNEEARTQLEKALKAEPGYLDAWVALASVRHILGDAKGAEAAIESAIKAHPENEARLREVFAQIKARKAENLPSPHANMPDPEAAAAPAPQTAASGAPIQVTVSIAPAATPRTGIVYVIARTEGADGGHPVAVKRIEAQSFPLTIELGGADSMMGGPLPATVRVEARLDSDGDAGTADSRDPNAAVDGVAAGSRVALKLE